LQPSKCHNPARRIRSWRCGRFLRAHNLAGGVGKERAGCRCLGGVVNRQAVPQAVSAIGQM
jgi:hypothetical protein